jgi:hypothetical protein
MGAGATATGPAPARACQAQPCGQEQEREIGSALMNTYALLHELVEGEYFIEWEIRALLTMVRTQTRSTQDPVVEARNQCSVPADAIEEFALAGHLMSI